MADLQNPIFHDDEKAREWLEAKVWPDGPVCPHCGTVEPTKLQGQAHLDRSAEQTRLLQFGLGTTREHLVGGSGQIKDQGVGAPWPFFVSMSLPGANMDPNLMIGKDRNLVRRDAYGNEIHWSAYGDRNSPFGWEIDHVRPTILGGGDWASNLRALHWRVNAGLGGVLGGLLNPNRKG